jgi:hypothetical protein
MPGYIQFTNPVSMRFSSTVPKVENRFSMKSLFTDNSRVIYKKGSLPSCGIGSVTNSRHKGIKT